MEDNIHLVFKQEIAKQGLALRSLSKNSGINISTLSRILNGKQRMSLAHLNTISNILKIKNETNDMVLQVVDEAFDFFQIDKDNLIDNIKKELNKYENYAMTQEGRDKILKDFEKKIRELNASGSFINKLNWLYKSFISAKNKKTLPVIGSVLLYTILSIDIIPDYAFPIGFLDDAIAINLVINRLANEFAIVF